VIPPRHSTCNSSRGEAANAVGDQPLAGLGSRQIAADFAAKMNRRAISGLRFDSFRRHGSPFFGVDFATGCRSARRSLEPLGHQKTRMIPIARAPVKLFGR